MSLVIRVVMLLGAMAPAVALSQSKGVTIWVEGERPAKSDVIRHPYWYDQVKKEQLSGGDWISHFTEEKDGWVEYVVAVRSAGTYALWIRANPVQSKLDYSVDGGSPQAVDLEHGMLDVVNVAADDKPDLRFVGWKKVADVALKPGDHRLRFAFSSPASHHGAIDCVVLTTEEFEPSGLNRPGQAAPKPEVPKGAWAFDPPRDEFRPTAVLDLRDRNEKVAGEAGFVRLSQDGNSFVKGDGQPIRFWSTNTYVHRDGTPEELAHHARFLAKRGVNMVRYHGHLEPKDKSKPLREPDEKALDEAWRLVAAMKKEGIYTTISPYWANTLGEIPASWGLEGWPEKQQPFALLFFNPALQAAYKEWLRALYTRPNPHTGIPLSKDPAVAIIQIQNEDSMLFWTMQNLKGRQAELLGQQFAAWSAKRYGSVEGAMRAWGNERVDGDDAAKGVLGQMIVWEWTQPRTGGRKKRLDDQLEFYAKTMFDFNKEIGRFLREDLGCEQLVNAGNWRTADTIRLNDVERLSYTANEVLAVNSYYSPIHTGPDNGWRIDRGDFFQDVSALKDPRSLPFNIKQVTGHPMIVTESHWVPPLGYQAEGPFTTAAYLSLTGVDSFYWFAAGEAEWDVLDRAEWNAASRKKWSVSTPAILGQFPACSLVFRRGDIRAAEPAVQEHRSYRQLWERVPPSIAEDPRYDPNRDLGVSAGRVEKSGVVDPLAFLVGPVTTTYAAEPKPTRTAELSRYIDTRKKVVRSLTGEVSLDYGRGLCTVDAPRAQGACGFLADAGPQSLSDVNIRSRNPYASVLVVSLDDQPIASSKRLLAQVATLSRPTGWAVKPVDREVDENGSKRQIPGFEITDTGKMPWAIAETQVEIEVANSSLQGASLLDANLEPVGDVELSTASGKARVVLPPNAMYVELRAE